MSRSPTRAALTALGLLLLLSGLYVGRKYFIRSWFELGSAQPLQPAPASAGPKGPPAQLRVLLVDGLGRRQARRLPEMRALCRSGLALELDVGFPTVSLPVQHVLWSGTWQQQSGVLFAVKRLHHPVFDTLPASLARRGGRSLALTEGQRYIVDSFPFSQVEAPGQLDPEHPVSQSFVARALAAARSPWELVLVHVLAVDEAGHHRGSASAEYRRAARRADLLLGQLARVRRPEQTLVVLADHGHLAAPPGGHGGLEPDVRWVQACAVGPGLPVARRGRGGLVDLTRLLARQLRVPPPAMCQGRPLGDLLPAAATSRPVQGAVSPETPPAARDGAPAGQRNDMAGWRARAAVGPAAGAERNDIAGWRARAAVAAAAGLTGLLLLLLAARRRWWLALPLGALVSVALLCLWPGPPSLSRYYVYRSLPWALWPVLLPALLLTAVQAAWLLRLGLGPLRVALLGAGAPLWLTVAALLPCGWPLSRPPLLPHLTAWASSLWLLAEVALLAVTLPLAGWAVWRWRWRVARAQIRVRETGCGSRRRSHLQ